MVLHNICILHGLQLEQELFIETQEDDELFPHDPASSGQVIRQSAIMNISISTVIIISLKTYKKSYNSKTTWNITIVIKVDSYNYITIYLLRSWEIILISMRYIGMYDKEVVDHFPFPRVV